MGVIEDGSLPTEQHLSMKWFTRDPKLFQSMTKGDGTRQSCHEMTSKELTKGLKWVRTNCFMTSKCLLINLPCPEILSFFFFVKSMLWSYATELQQNMGSPFLIRIWYVYRLLLETFGLLIFTEGFSRNLAQWQHHLLKGKHFICDFILKHPDLLWLLVSGVDHLKKGINPILLQCFHTLSSPKSWTQNR